MTKPLPKSLVLYADDDPDDILLVTETFKDYDRSVELITFPDGVALLDYVNALDVYKPGPCLIILDINMPKLNGKEVLMKLRNTPHISEVPVVLFSTSTLPSEAEFAKSFGAAFITKPLDAKQMHKVIDQFIDNCTEETKKQIRERQGKS
jgi:CheY-like chemotaxis protein